MLEQLLIFTRGGLILWTYKELANALRGSPIDALIRSCLLEDRSALTSFQYDAPGCSYTLKWSFHNDLGLVFVAVYRKILHLLYVDELLEKVKSEFSPLFNPSKADYPDFDDTFRQLLLEAEARAEELRQANQAKSFNADGARRNASGDKRGSKSSSGLLQDGAKGDEDGGKNSKKEYISRSVESAPHHANGSTSPFNGNGSAHAGDPKVSLSSGSDEENGSTKVTEVAFNVDKLKKLKSKGGKKGASKAPLPAKDDKANKKVKVNRVWDDAPNKKLDYSNPSSNDAKETPIGDQGKSLMDAEDDDDSDLEMEEDIEVNNSKEKEIPKKKGWFSSLIQSVAGKAIIEEDDLAPALKSLRERLLVKNVAQEITDELSSSVATSLVGKKMASLTRISTTVLKAMEEALTRILTPKRSIDILRDVHTAKEQGRPYVVVFCGVNGVGKSTNLAKVAYWLMQHNVSVMMAACDTFRSGAVEQLRTHANRLQISLFQRGYEKDPAFVAKEAIREATLSKIDVVLVDTAGRMQDNEPLMRALAKLVHINNPDLVLFVGEALVGNDGVDQLMKFNQKLIDLSTSSIPRRIDGILLTKFDTVDDKVGAALSMVYKSGAPIMFLGCGQTYTDLKKLNVKSIIKSLLS
ncbi:hypothetical protein KP509_36G014900 [Ceratopteris richardii]|uniref:SRP54-type proteins GTP-binding domain-containing protein n=1 Tax=Ceratopteris richardii TaxID=49495 RepID=A0A8T2QAH1_CERRI|nr:hypothetical protein KP509_36G014900 [Ceratopteris richardii]